MDFVFQESAVGGVSSALGGMGDGWGEKRGSMGGEEGAILKRQMEEMQGM